MPSINVTSACHCGVNSFSLNFPASSSSQPTDFCHCTSCRRSTGAPFNTFIELPSAPFSESEIPTTLHTYKSSDSGTRYFCTTCGAHMAMSYSTVKKFYIASGTLSSIDGVYQPSWHQWLCDTGDGGISRLIDDGLPRYTTGKESEKFEQPARTLGRVKQETEGSNDVLKASCRCNAIRLTITRPLTNPSGPGVAEKATSDRRRWTSGNCFCASCRLTSGFPMATFVSVGLEHVKIEDREGKLVGYKSSPPVTRSFCGTCGATVTYKHKDSPWVDVATGLLEVDVEKGEGVMGEEEDWWVYDEKTDFPEEGREKGLVEAVRRDERAR